MCPRKSSLRPTDLSFTTSPSAASPMEKWPSSQRCQPSCRRSPRSDLKPPSQFKLIGRKDIGRVDVPSKVNGTARYGIDVQVPGMIYASVLQSPMDGAKAESVNTDEVMKIKGVTRVIALPFGVAVVGDTVEATRKGRNART